MTGDPINFSRAYLGRRCKKLKEKGLIREISDATSVITDDSEASLEGRLDTENWTYIDENADEVTATDSGGAPGESNGGAT